MKTKICRLGVAVGSAALLVMALAASLVAASPTGRFVLLTTTSAGSLIVENRPSLDNAGHWLAFHSDSDILGQGIPEYQSEVWLYQIGTMTTTRVTTSSDGMSRDSWNPSLSADGTKVAFESDSSFPGHTIPDNQFEIWLYDRVARTYTRVTTSTPASRVSENPSLNEDGTVIAFASDSAFWGGTIPVTQLEIWLYDIPSATFTRVTTGTTAYLPGLAQSNHPSLSGDGTRIAFESNTNFLNPSEGTRTEIWLYDTQTLTFTRVTTASGSDRESLEPAISLDGTKIAFQSDSNLAGHVITAEHYEIWLYDIAAMTYTRVTTSTGSGYRWSTTPSLDRTGSQVIFSSDSDLLHEGIGDNMHEIWRYDVPTGQLTRLTRNSNTNRDSWLPRISANGRLIAFVSDSNLLNVGLSDDQYEFWLYDSRERLYLPLVLR